MTNAEIALDFQKMVISGRVRDAYEKYVGPNFRHHNPYFRGDRSSLLAGMEENAARFPQKRFDVRHVIADGDLVSVHSRRRLAEETPEVAVVHIFRFEQGMIVEEWDVGQPVPPEIVNENGMF